MNLIKSVTEKSYSYIQNNWALNWALNQAFTSYIHTCNSADPSALCKGISALSRLQDVVFRASFGLSGIELIKKSFKNCFYKEGRQRRARRIGTQIQFYKPTPNLRERALATARIAMGLGTALTLLELPKACASLLS